MDKATRCSIIIKDDFNNVLIIQRKVKRGEPKVWSLVSKNLRNREDEEKCITRAVKEDLKSIIFDLDIFGEYGNTLVFQGNLKERIERHKDIIDSKWAKLDSIKDLEFNEDDKNAIIDYFKK